MARQPALSSLAEGQVPPVRRLRRVGAQRLVVDGGGARVRLTRFSRGRGGAFRSAGGGARRSDPAPQGWDGRYRRRLPDGALGLPPIYGSLPRRPRLG